MEIRVLIVDGSKSELSFVGKALEEVGVEYKTLSNTQGVLEEASTYMPTLVITDMQTDPTGGFSVVQQIKSCPSTQHIPVVFFSASNKQEDVIKGLHFGCVDYINRPINVQDFVKVVLSHSSVQSMRDILSPLKSKTSELMIKYGDNS